MKMGAKMGRKRKPDEEKTKTLAINLKQKVIDEIAKEGKPKTIVESIINQRFDNKA